jgi:chromosome segregation and condensation protein ScpB
MTDTEKLEKLKTTLKSLQEKWNDRSYFLEEVSKVTMYPYGDKPGMMSELNTTQFQVLKRCSCEVGWILNEYEYEYE